MSGKNWEAEDGMGFAGMVPTLAEKRQDEYEQRQRDRMRTLESQVSTLQATNTTLQREIAELKATNAALALDAARYRYIRDSSDARAIPIVTMRCGGDRLDSVIDAALAASAGERKGEVE